MAVGDWEDPARRRLAMLLASGDGKERLAVLVNGDRRACRFVLPERSGFLWQAALSAPFAVDPSRTVPDRSIAFMIERVLASSRGRLPD